MRYAVGLDLGGTAIKAGLVAENGDIVAETSLPTGPPEPAAVVNRLARITETLVELGSERLGRRPDVVGIGVGAPGLCDAAGTVLWAPNLSWRDVPLAPLLSERTGLPVRADNDANAATFAEVWAGAAAGLQHVVLLTLGTGVGGGVVLDGELYRGSRYWAGEIGHMPAGTAGRRCACGKPDCLEAYASATAIARRGRELYDTPEAAALRQLAPEPDALEARHVTEAAAAGDAVAGRLIAEAAEALAYVIGGVINLLNPEAVLIGGGVAKAGETLLGPLRAALSTYALPEPLAGCTVRTAALGNKAGLIGAAGLWLHGGRTAGGSGERK